jgi:hypothetical protein
MNIVLAIMLLAVAWTGPALAQTPTPVEKTEKQKVDDERKGKLMSACNHRWTLYRKSNSLKGKDINEARKEYLARCLSGNIPAPPTGAP